MTTERAVKYMIVGLAAIGAACTVSNTPAPPLTGPSELSLSLLVTAKPDILTANGSDYSDITITARDATGQAAAGRDLRVDVVNDADKIIQVGTLFPQGVVTTNSAGEVTVRFPAPMETTPGVDNNPAARIRVLPISSNSSSQIGRYLTIRLVPRSTIVLPGAPTAFFTVSTETPSANQLVLFNPGGSSDADGFIVQYAWDFGDGEHAITTKPDIQDHDYPAGQYTATLTVTDNDNKLSALFSRQIVVK